MKPLAQPMIVRLTTGARSRAIARIMEARFMLTAFDQIRDGTIANWTSPANVLGRGIYDQAILEKRRLQRAPDALICAALAELPSAR
jgi:hypothetical protein